MGTVADTRNAEWSWDEHVLALDLYMSNPASPPRKDSREVAGLSDLLNKLGRINGVSMTDKFRNANGVYMKMMNFRRFDPMFQAQGKAGLSQGSRGEADVWNRFAGDHAELRQVADGIRRRVAGASSRSTLAPDPVNFAAAQARFRRLIAANDKGHAFTNFHEGVAAAWEDYKPRLRARALELLNAENWTETMIGSGRILGDTISAIEIQDARINLTNNLVFWQNRYGHANRDHHALLDATTSSKLRAAVERLLFDLYHADESRVFDELAAFADNKYPLMAYLYFLKDADRYMPIQPTTFDQAFRDLGVELVTLRACSWENYRAYNEALGNVRAALQGAGGVREARLIDAHSFCWMIEKLPADQPVSGTSSRKDAGRVVAGRDGSIIRMCLSIENTDRNSNGQTVQRTLKNKELRMTRYELEKLLRELMDVQENRCALTGIPFNYHGPGADRALLPSPDRIDSGGQYERGNLQIVCQFVNMWKSDTNNEEFKGLLRLVRTGAMSMP